MKMAEELLEIQTEQQSQKQTKEQSSKSYTVCIHCLGVIFSDRVSGIQKAALKELSKKNSMKICEIPAGDFRKICPDFCITDFPDICRMAQERGIPSLLYLHEGNKEESMTQIPYAIMDLESLDYEYLCNVYKRFYNIPWTILETKRCILREMTEDDLDALYEVYKDPEVSRYTENLYEDREKERAYIRDYIEHVYRLCGLGIWVIELKATGVIIGRAGLAWRDGYDTPEIGFVIGKNYQKQGYAFEICDAILRYCKEIDLKMLRVLYQKENTASDKLCKKLGFEIKREFEEDGKQMIDAIKILS